RAVAERIVRDGNREVVRPFVRVDVAATHCELSTRERYRAGGRRHAIAPVDRCCVVANGFGPARIGEEGHRAVERGALNRSDTHATQGQRRVRDRDGGCDALIGGSALDGNGKIVGALFAVRVVSRDRECAVGDRDGGRIGRTAVPPVDRCRVAARRLYPEWIRKCSQRAAERRIFYRANARPAEDYAGIYDGNGAADAWAQVLVQDSDRKV